MKFKQIQSQLSNAQTNMMYLRQLLTLAENVFEFPNLPKFIDTAYLNKNLVRKGSIAFFYDEVMGLLALPYTNISNLDVYGRPRTIQVLSRNGYTRILGPDEFIIMYDNNGRYPLFLDIVQYAARMALDTRVADINILQQKTPRFFKTTTDKEKSVKDLVNNVDSFENTVITYDGIDINDTTVVPAPAPYVANLIDEHKEKDWSEFLRLIGVSNLSFQKKERNISDEIAAMQGGTIASRYSRYEPRKKAIDEINLKWGDKLEVPIEVKYYDGLPTSIKELENDFGEEDDIDDI